MALDHSYFNRFEYTNICTDAKWQGRNRTNDTSRRN